MNFTFLSIHLMEIANFLHLQHLLNRELPHEDDKGLTGISWFMESSLEQRSLHIVLFPLKAQKASS